MQRVNLLIVFLWILAHMILGLLYLVGVDMQGRKAFQDTDYRLVLYDVGIGAFWVVAFLVWYLWLFIATGLWRLFKTVHSAQRVACGVDSVICGLVVVFTFRWWGPAAPTFFQYIVAILFGAFVGGAVGLATSQFVVWVTRPAETES